MALGREHDHAGRRIAGAYLAESSQSARARHEDIEQYEFGPLLAKEPYRFIPVARLDDVVPSARQRGTAPRADEGRVISHQDTCHRMDYGGHHAPERRQRTGVIFSRPMVTGGRLQDRVALVTGAGSGIGREIALGYAREGARVAAADRNLAAAQETAALDSGGRIRAFHADVTDPASVRQAVAGVVAAFSALDVLVNNAAIQLHGRDGRCHEVDEATWHETIAVNLTGPFLCAKYCLPHLIARRGAIVNLASPTAFQDIGAGYTAYATSKGGIATLNRVLAADYARDGVRVNAIVPGPTQTNLTAAIFRDPAIRDPLVARTPLGRLGQPSDLVGIAIFLASDEAAYATGALFFVDGGLTMA